MPIRFMGKLNQALKDVTGLDNNLQSIKTKQYRKRGFEVTGNDGPYVYLSNGNQHIKIDMDGNVFDIERPNYITVMGAIGETKKLEKLAPDMPKVEPEDGIERYDAYTRINPKGHKELVHGDDEETLNELSDDLDRLLENSAGLKKIAKQRQDRSKDVDESPITGLARMIKGLKPIDDFESVEEGIAFAGPKSTGGGAGSPEQIEYTRRRNKFTPELVNSDGDKEREAGDTITNMTYSTKQASDGPEQSRAKYKSNVPDKNIIGYSGMSEDQVRKIASVIEESFTGTGAIAISPVGGYDTVSDKASKKKKSKKKSNELTETDMNRQQLSGAIENILKEWQPSFDGGEYSPGEGGVEAPSGEGVADKRPKKDSVGKAPTNMSNHGDAFGASHNETAAMCDVGENGVEDKPQGSHESSVGDPTDGYQSKMGHDWPAQPKLSGGAAEEVEGQSYDKGGVVKGAAATDMEAGRTKGGPKMGVAEQWNPSSIGSLMEGEDGNIQTLFDKYAREYNIVCLEDFQAICNANAKGVTLSMESMLNLMKTNSDFIFYEGHDANGPYWTPTPHSNISEAQIRPTPDSGDMEDMGDFDEYKKKEAMHGPGKFSGASGCPECGEHCDGPQCMNCGCEMGDDGEAVYGGVEDEGFDEVDDIDEMFTSYSAFGDEQDYDDFAYNVRQDLTPSDDDYRYTESLKRFLGSAKSILENSGNYSQADVGAALVASWNNYASGVNPLAASKKVKQTLHNLSESFPAFNILEGFEQEYQHWMQRCSEDPVQCAMDFADYLDSSGTRKGGRMAQVFRDMAANPEERDFWMGGVTGAKNFEQAVQFAISNYLFKKNGLGKESVTPAGDALQESNDAMDSPDGSELGTGGHKPDKMADQPGPDDGEDHGHYKSSHKQASPYDKTPVMKGTGKGMSESKQSRIMKANITRLSRYVSKALKESSGGLRGKYNSRYNIVVSENGMLNRTPARYNLTEALADAEEILQMHEASDVDLEATFTDTKGSVVLQQEVPLFTIKPRGVVQSEGASIFRFKRTAEKFADQLVAEGRVCRVVSHNWGHSVISG
ncbi:hypothetical protein N9045_00495 [bacterium]|nr:hypothetical protein [bacterium]